MPASTTEPLGVLARAQDSFGVPPNAPANEWPFNILSQHAVRFAGGRIGRAGDALPAADPAEQKLCDDLSAKAAAAMNKLAAPPAVATFDPFRLPALPGEPAAVELTAELIRERFGGTLHPWARVAITPLADARSYDLSKPFFGVFPAFRTTNDPRWTAVRNWFKKNRHLTGGGWAVEASGAGVIGSQAVRLLVGLTNAGSVVGCGTAGLVRGLTPDTPVAGLYRQLRKSELSRFKPWLDGGSGRAVARVILRSFPPGVMASGEGAWTERTRAAAAAVRSQHRGAFWRSEFHKLTAERELVLPPVWEGVQRCLTTGRWDAEWLAEARPYFDPERPFEGFGQGEDGFFLLDPDAVRATSERLAALDERWLKGKYADLRATDYAPFLSAADWKATAAVYAQTAQFYAHAAAHGLAVVSEITARTDAEIAAETAHPTSAGPSKKVKGKKGACAADEVLLAPLLPAMETHGSGDGGEWPHNDLSAQLVRFGCGRIAREGEEVEHTHAKGEVDRIRELAAEAERRLAGCVPDYDQRGPFRAFFAAANKGEDVPDEFTEEWVRETLFRGTINPECGVGIGPITAGELWYEGSAAAAEFVPWFTSQPGLHGHAFVSIGLDEDHGGATHPRMAVAFTEQGSVVGVCGYVVWA